MTLNRRKRIAMVLKKIVRAEVPEAWLRNRLYGGLRHLAEKAQQMGLQPEDVLTDNGRDAFIAIAVAVLHGPWIGPVVPLRAEWLIVIQLAAPPLEERLGRGQRLTAIRCVQRNSVSTS